MLKQDQLLDRIGAEIKMENGEKKEAMQEKAVVEETYINDDGQKIETISDKFYGGADMRASRIRILSNKSFPIELED